MSDIAIQIQVIHVPKDWMWKHLKDIIEEGQATSLGNRTYEFHHHGYGCTFQSTCDHYEVKYKVTFEG